MNISRGDLEELKMVYKTAVENKKDTFKFKGELLNRNYAKYLIEYLEGQPEAPTDRPIIEHENFQRAVEVTQYINQIRECNPDKDMAVVQDEDSGVVCFIENGKLFPVFRVLTKKERAEIIEKYTR